MLLLSVAVRANSDFYSSLQPRLRSILVGGLTSSSSLSMLINICIVKRNMPKQPQVPPLNLPMSQGDNQEAILGTLNRAMKDKSWRIRRIKVEANVFATAGQRAWGAADVDFEMCRLSSRCRRRIAREIEVARSYIRHAEAGAGAQVGNIVSSSVKRKC